MSVTLPTETTQNAVMASLIDALTLLAALSDVTVTDAPFDRGLVPGDQVAILGIDDGDETVYGIGNFRRDESYTIRMACIVIRDGADQATIRACNERAYAIYQAVAGYIRANPRHGGVTIKQLTGVNYQPGYEQTTRWTWLEWGVRVNAQIEVA